MANTFNSDLAVLMHRDWATWQNGNGPWKPGAGSVSSDLKPGWPSWPWCAGG